MAYLEIKEATSTLWLHTDEYMLATTSYRKCVKQDVEGRITNIDTQTWFKDLKEIIGETTFTLFEEETKRRTVTLAPHDYIARSK